MSNKEMSKKLIRLTKVVLFVASIVLAFNSISKSFRSYQHSLRDTLDHSRLVELTNLPLEVIRAKSQTHKLVQIMQRHKEMWESYYLGGASKVLDSREEENFLRVLNLLENSYPFNRKYYKSVWDLYSSYQGRGIVMTTGNGYTKYDHELM